MSREARAELISAYLDDQLQGEEAERFEKLLAEDESVRREVEGMRSVVSNLRHLERMAPPSSLDQHVARRIALAGEQRSLLDRIEGGLSSIQGPSHHFLMFSLVFALAIIVYLFSVYLDKGSQLPVIFDSPPNNGTVIESIEGATSVLMGSRHFLRQEDGRWIEADLTAEEIESAESMTVDSPAGRELLQHHPDLKGLTLLGTSVFELHGRVIELRSSLVHGPVHEGL